MRVRKLELIGGFQKTWQRDSVLQTLRTILTETLDNVGEHAYRKRGFGAVFARVRQGTPEEPHEFTQWRDARLLERRYCPTMGRNNFGKHPGWLEIFVCDVGRGLLSELSSDEKSPLLSLSNELFRRPLSRYKDRPIIGKTKMTGLQHIGYALRSGSEEGGLGGFIRVYTAGEWLGEHFPWPPHGVEASHENYRNDNSLSFLHGTLLHFCLEPSMYSASNRRKIYPTYFFIPDLNNLAPIRKAMSNLDKPLFQPPNTFIDLFVYQAADADRPARGRAVSDWASSIDKDTVILRPPRAIRKIDFLSQINSIGRYSKRPPRRLIYADVPPYALIDLGLLLTEDQLSDLWPIGDLEIYLLSQDWSCAAFKLNNDRTTFSPSIELARAFVVNENSGTVGAGLIAEILRERDSFVFWKEVGDAYISEPVRWTSSTLDDDVPRIIHGYLDIPLALVNVTSYRAARRAMRRAILSFATDLVLTADDPLQQVVQGDFVVFDGSKPFIGAPFQIRSATGQHRRHGGVSGGGKGRGQGL